MERTLSPDQTELLAWHRANGCIEVRHMAPGTRVCLETEGEYFELEVSTPERGVVLVATSKRFKHREKAVILGCHDPKTRIFLPEIIGQDLIVVLRVQDVGVIRTHPVMIAIVRDREDTYEYNVWDN